MSEKALSFQSLGDLGKGSKAALISLSCRACQVRRKPVALSSCLFETLGQDQFSGGLHYHTGHRPGNSVLQRGWQRRAWCLGVLRPHRSPEAQILQDDKRKKTQMYATGRSQGEAQPARVSWAGFWAGSRQPHFSHDACRAGSTQVDEGQCPQDPETDRLVICVTQPQGTVGIIVSAEALKWTGYVSGLSSLPISGRSSEGWTSWYWENNEVTFFSREGSKK